MFFVDTLDHTFIKVNGRYFIVDTCYTVDCGWETGIAEVYADRIKEEIFDGEPITDEDVENYAEESWDFMGEWKVQNYSTRKQAEKGHKRVCKNGRLDEED